MQMAPAAGSLMAVLRQKKSLIAALLKGIILSHDALIDALSGTIKTTLSGDICHLDRRGRLHRTNGPAIILTSGVEMWYYKGERHRIDGPAVIRPDGVCHWFLFGSQVSEEEFIERVRDWA